MDGYLGEGVGAGGWGVVGARLACRDANEPKNNFLLQDIKSSLKHEICLGGIS
jgi:hypothetical protein